MRVFGPVQMRPVPRLTDWSDFDLLHYERGGRIRRHKRMEGGQNVDKDKNFTRQFVFSTQHGVGYLLDFYSLRYERGGRARRLAEGVWFWFFFGLVVSGYGHWLVALGYGN